MRRVSRVTLGVVASGLLLASSSVAGNDRKNYPGSLCSFADNPLDSHNKIHHRLKNTSSEWQWVTCPLVRDSVYTDDIDYMAAFVVGDTSNGRLEQTELDYGTLTGWNMSMSYAASGDIWYLHSANPENNDVAMTFEIKLAPGAYVRGYEMNEYDDVVE